VKDAISTALWVVIALWYLYVLATVPEAPNPPPKTSRFWLSHKLLGGRRLGMTLAGMIVIGLVGRFVISAID
jgi:hypothetical protein